MPSWWTRLAGGRTRVPEEQKAATSLFALTDPGEAIWTSRGYASLAQAGFMRNPIVYRSVRMVAEAAARIPLSVGENGARLGEHPVLALLLRPNPHKTGPDLFETLYAHLQTAGNAYLAAALLEGEVCALYGLRPDRMKVVPGKDGWPLAYTYTAGNKARHYAQNSTPISQVLHLTLFHPLDDHYGLSPLEAARTSLDTHNSAARWTKSLLDNAARPSGALVYSAAAGNLSAEQFQRLKSELEQGFQGAANAGRPMVLEGGLDWKNMSMSPKDMDFIETRNAAAREIALAFGVPPMLLGIPGDATYANYAEANRALWRQTVIPLVRKVAAALNNWLAPAFDQPFTITPCLDAIEALAGERAALWARIGAAGFLTEDEKRDQLGLPRKPGEPSNG